MSAPIARDRRTTSMMPKRLPKPCSARRALISMMARSKCSNQRPDTLMQDRSPPARRNHLQRAAGPYIAGHSETEAFMPFLISPGLRLYEFLITNGRKSALRHVTRQLWHTRHLVAADQPPPNLDGSS